VDRPSKFACRESGFLPKILDSRVPFRLQKGDKEEFSKHASFQVDFKNRIIKPEIYKK
jgi:hypothetical protein